MAEGDLVIVAAYCWLDREDIPDHRARVVLVDEGNHVTDRTDPVRRPAPGSSHSPIQGQGGATKAGDRSPALDQA